MTVAPFAAVDGRGGRVPSGDPHDVRAGDPLARVPVASGRCH